MQRTSGLVVGHSIVLIGGLLCLASADPAIGGGLTEVTLEKHLNARKVGTISESIDVSFRTSATSASTEDNPENSAVLPDYTKAPLVVTVDLDRQYLTAYKGLDISFESRISSGKSGHTTPMGIFSILEKKKYHESNLYSNAPMPFMQRLTWSGIALHQGRVPPYPASHGCIRIPEGLAKQLFGKTGYGTHVVITRGTAKPVPVSHWQLPQPDRMANTLAALRPVITAVSNDNSRQVRRSEAPLRVYVTRSSRRDRHRSLQEMLIELGYLEGTADGIYGRQTVAAVRAFQRSEMLKVNGTASNETIDRLLELTGRSALPMGKIYVRQKQKPVFEADIGISNSEQPLGTHLAYVGSFSEDRADWLSIAVPTRLRRSTISDNEMDTIWKEKRVRVSFRSAMNRIDLPREARDFLSRNLTAGSSFAISDNGWGTETGKGTDFIVQTY